MHESFDTAKTISYLYIHLVTRLCGIDYVIKITKIKVTPSVSEVMIRMFFIVFLEFSIVNCCLNVWH